MIIGYYYIIRVWCPTSWDDLFYNPLSSIDQIMLVLKYEIRKKYFFYSVKKINTVEYDL